MSISILNLSGLFLCYWYVSENSLTFHLFSFNMWIFFALSVVYGYFFLVFKPLTVFLVFRVHCFTTKLSFLACFLLLCSVHFPFFSSSFLASLSLETPAPSTYTDVLRRRNPGSSRSLCTQGQALWKSPPWDQRERSKESWYFVVMLAAGVSWA